MSSIHPRGLSGAQNSMNPQNQRASSSTRSAQLGQSSSADSLSSNLWFYTQPDSAKGAQPPGPSSSSMIPPTSSYYNPDDTHHNESHGQYQQWLDSFNSQQQQQQQPQQVEYSSSYRRPAAPGPISQQSGQNTFSFMQGQYASGSVTQYAASNSDTVTQGAGSDPTTYQSQTSDIYSAFYPEMLSMANNSTASSPDNAHSYHTSTPESALHSYSNTPDPVYQQQHFSQHQQPAHAPSGQIEQKANQSSQFLIPQTARYLPSQRNRSEFGTPASNSNASSHASSLSPPPNAWTSESVYSTKKSGTSSAGSQLQQSKIRDNHTSAGKAGTSQLNVVTAAKRPDVSAKTSAQTSPPRASRVASGTAASTSAAAGAKRKRAKKDDTPEWSSNQAASGYAAGDASDSDSDDDDDGSGLGMSGAIGVGLGGLGVVGRGGKKENRSRLDVCAVTSGPWDIPCGNELSFVPWARSRAPTALKERKVFEG